MQEFNPKQIQISMSDYFTDSEDEYKNKLGITNADELKEAEVKISYIRQVEIESEPLPSRFSFELLKCIHLRLFGDIYDFAGKIRTVDITKGTIPFCYMQNIESEQARIFNALARDNYLINLSQAVFAERIAHYASELNALHPFREGNGRTIRLFLRLMAKNAGYQIQYDQCDHNELIHADIAAFRGNPDPLLKIYQKIIIYLE